MGIGVGVDRGGVHIHNVSLERVALLRVCHPTPGTRVPRRRGGGRAAGGRAGARACCSCVALSAAAPDAASAGGCHRSCTFRVGRQAGGQAGEGPGRQADRWSGGGHATGQMGSSASRRSSGRRSGSSSSSISIRYSNRSDRSSSAQQQGQQHHYRQQPMQKRTRDGWETQRVLICGTRHKTDCLFHLFYSPFWCLNWYPFWTCLEAANGPASRP